MRRIAVVATGAVAAAAAVSLTAGTAGAGTSGTAIVIKGSTAATVPADSVSTDATKTWKSYNGYKTVYGHGTYSKGKSSVTVDGSVWDGRSKSSTYHAALVLVFKKGTTLDVYEIVNPSHGVTAYFPGKIKTPYLTHFYVAEGLAQYKKGKWTIVKQGSLHKVY